MQCVNEIDFVNIALWSWFIQICIAGIPEAPQPLIYIYMYWNRLNVALEGRKFYRIFSLRLWTVCWVWVCAWMFRCTRAQVQNVNVLLSYSTYYRIKENYTTYIHTISYCCSEYFSAYKTTTKCIEAKMVVCNVCVSVCCLIIIDNLAMNFCVLYEWCNLHGRRAHSDLEALHRRNVNRHNTPLT